MPRAKSKTGKEVSKAPDEVPKTEEVKWRSGPNAGKPVIDVNKGEEVQQQPEGMQEGEEGGFKPVWQPTPEQDMIGYGFAKGRRISPVWAEQPQEQPQPQVPATSRIQEAKEKMKLAKELTSKKSDIERIADAMNMVNTFRQMGVDVDPQLIIKMTMQEEEGDKELLDFAKEMIKYRRIIKLIDTLDPDYDERRRKSAEYAALEERLNRLEQLLASKQKQSSDLEALDRAISLIDKVNSYQTKLVGMAKPPEGWIGALTAIINALSPLLKLVSNISGGSGEEIPPPP